MCAVPAAAGALPFSSAGSYVMVGLLVSRACEQSVLPVWGLVAAPVPERRPSPDPPALCPRLAPAAEQHPGQVGLREAAAGGQAAAPGSQQGAALRGGPPAGSRGVALRPQAVGRHPACTAPGGCQGTGGAGVQVWRGWPSRAASGPAQQHWRAFATGPPADDAWVPALRPDLWPTRPPLLLLQLTGLPAFARLRFVVHPGVPHPSELSQTHTSLEELHGGWTGWGVGIGPQVGTPWVGCGPQRSVCRHRMLSPGFGP